MGCNTLNNNEEKTLFRASQEEISAAAKRKDSAKGVDKKNIFRLDSAAYYKAKNERVFSQPPLAPPIEDDVPKDLIPPDIASYLTTEIPLAQIVEGMGERYAKAKSAVENFPYDLGGHMTQTIELSLISSEMVRAADTKFGVFVEIEEAMEPGEMADAKAYTNVIPAIDPQRIGNMDAAVLAVVGEAADTGAEMPGDEHHEPEAKNIDEILQDAVAESWHNEALPSSELHETYALNTGEIPQKDIAAPWKSTAEDNVKKPFITRLFPPRLLAFLVAAVILFAPLTLFSTVLRIVYVYVDGEKVYGFMTSQTSTEEMLLDGGYNLRPADRYRTEIVGGVYKVDLERSVRVIVMCDGGFTEHYVLYKTAGETLRELEIVLGEDDETSIPLSTMLNEGDILEVYRVTYEYYEKTEVVEWQSVEKYSPLIGEGKRQIMNEGAGQDGEAIRTYREKYINGALAETTIDDEKYTVFPVDEVTLVGDPGAIMSTVEAGKYTDIKIVDNKPEEYYDVLVDGICTAYSFSPGTFGASGMYMIQGFVAVNTDVIPYGTLLYITSSDGSFVYGWAVAADVGTAMMDGRVDIDCFFETYTESALFGKKTLQVYMVKQLTQADLEEYAANSMFYSRVPE